MFKLKQYSLKVYQIDHHLQATTSISQRRKILQQKSKDLVFSASTNNTDIICSSGDSGPAQGQDCKNKVFKHPYELGKASLQYFITGNQAMHHAAKPRL